jgi:pimeloyl-ACP methyl ester carboxylesterase
MQAMRIDALRRLPGGYGLLAKRPIEPAVLEAYVRPFLTDSHVRRDAVAFLRGIDERYTLEAAEQLRHFRKPVLLAWAREDRVFPWAQAERLAAVFPDARLEPIDDSYTMISEDQPERLAHLIEKFAIAAPVVSREAR